MNGRDEYNAHRPETMREMLDMIDEFLARGDGESAQVWNVITAMRGPDDCDDRVKERVTIPLRRAAFPRTAERFVGGGRWPGTVPSFHGPDTIEMDTLKLTDAHLGYHANDAALALGVRVIARPVFDTPGRGQQ